MSNGGSAPGRRLPILPAAGMLLLLLLPACGLLAGTPQSPPAGNGAADLSARRFTDQGPLQLAGEWEFHPGLLYDPRDGDPLPGEGRTMHIPGFWNRQHRDLSPYGCGTLRLEVELPDSAERYGLYVEEVQTAYRLFVNGKLLLENGKVANDRAGYRARNVPRMYFFEPGGRSAEIVIQIANFRDVKAGMLEAPLIGTPRQVSLRHSREVGLDLFFFGGIFVMGLYYLLIFFYRGMEGTSFFFSLVCFSLALRAGLTGSRFIPTHLPAMSFELYTALEFVSIYLAALALYFYFRSRYPRESWPPFTHVTWVVIGFLIVSASLTPIRYHVPLFIVFEVYTLLMVAAILWGSILAVRRGRPGSIPFLASFLLLGLLIPVDMAYYQAGTGSFFVLHYGLFVFVLVQAASLASRFTRLEREAKLYAASLEDRNVSLSEQLNKQNRELSFVQRSLSAARRKDFLTGLFNEQVLSSHLSKLEKERSAGKGPESLAIISLDIDGFEELNRRLGKSYGDFLLIHCAALLEYSGGEEATVYRGHGDEFLILLPGAAADTARSFVETFEEDLRKGKYLPKRSENGATETIPQLTFSTGIRHAELGTGNGETSPPSLSQMLGEAREARRRAQRSSPGRIIFFSGTDAERPRGGSGR